MNLITFDPQTQTFHLRNQTISYLFNLTEDQLLQSLYFGQTLKHYSGHKNYPDRDRGFSGNIPGNPARNRSKDTLPQEFSSHGSMDYRIPASIFRRDNGSDLQDFRYLKHEIMAGKPELVGLPQSYMESTNEGETLIITLKDRFTELFLELSYTIFADYPTIARSAKVINQTGAPVKIEKLASMQLDFTANQRFEQVISLPGAHALERQIQREKLTKGVKSFESRRGSSSHQMNSFIALTSQQTTETQGEALGIHLVYSGDHRFQLEKDQLEQLRLVAGINDETFSWELAPGDSFQTPEALLFYSNEGLNGLSQGIHHLLRERVARGKHRFSQRPILVNNWEATYFDFDMDKLKAIVDEAANLGIEMFVLDDGWFGHRDDDNSSLGDWFEYQGKLADGLKGVADYVHEKGLKFGLWVEPEMISVDSQLFTDHPDFRMQEPDRTPASSRDQFVLDLGREAIRENIEEQLKALLDRIPIDYIKWDMNRNISDAYSSALPADRQGEVRHRYMLQLYQLMENLTSRYPDILWEGCSGGGGRFDAGFMYYMPQSWTSDNTDAVDRMKIQYGTSLAYPISNITAHVSAVPNHQTGRITSLKTRGDVAMSGVFGYELDLSKMSSADKTTAKEQVAFYQKHRQLVQYGNFYRLESPFTGNLTAWNFVSPDQREALLFVGRTLTNGQPTFTEITMLGLNPAATYQNTTTNETWTGAELMQLGQFLPDFWGDFQTTLIYFKQID